MTTSKPTTAEMLTSILNRAVETATEDQVSDLRAGLKKLHDKVDALVEKVDALGKGSVRATTATDKKPVPKFEWDGGVPEDYVGAVGIFLKRKDPQGNPIGGHKLLVPAQLLDSGTPFAYHEGKFIVPMKIKGGGVQLVAVDEDIDLGEPHTGQYDLEGLQCHFIEEYYSIPRDNPYHAPKAGSQPAEVTPSEDKEAGGW